jgi:hypothetical protein
MTGRWQPPDARSMPVEMTWSADSASAGRLAATLGPGGEVFEGTYVQVTSSTEVERVEPILRGWGPVWRDYPWGAGYDPWYWGPGPPYTPGYVGAHYGGFVREYSGRVVATLFGSAGHTMRCRFTLSEPLDGVAGGGVGECQTSDGGVLDFTF